MQCLKRETDEERRLHLGATRLLETWFPKCLRWIQSCGGQETCQEISFYEGHIEAKTPRVEALKLYHMKLTLALIQ